jgi:hypothetical protein
VFVHQPLVVELSIERPTDAPPELVREIRLPWLQRVVDLDSASTAGIDQEVFEIEERGRRLYFDPVALPDGRTRLTGSIRILVPSPGRLDCSGSMLRLDPRTTANYGEAKGEGPRLEVAASPVAVEVMPFPGGAPPEFVDAVGDLEVETRLDRARVEVGEIVHIEILARAKDPARSNLARALFVKDIAVPGFRVFGRNDQRVDEPARAELLIRLDAAVTHSRVRELPALRFAWFDADQARYQTATTARVEIAVIAPAESGAPTDEADADERRSRGTRWERARAWAYVGLALGLVALLWRARRAAPRTPAAGAGAVRETLEADASARLSRIVASPAPYSIDTARDVAACLAARTHRSSAACFGAGAVSALREVGASAEAVAIVERYFAIVEGVAFGGQEAPDRTPFDETVKALESVGRAANRKSGGSSPAR